MDNRIFWALAIVFQLPFIVVKAQVKATYSITGKVKSSQGEVLTGASVRILEFKNTGVSAGLNGEFLLQSQPGDYTLQVSYIGYITYTQKINIRQNQYVSIILQPATNLEAVTIRRKRAIKKADNQTAYSGQLPLAVQELNQVPVLMGEKDIMKTMQLFPGVKTASEGATGFNVRGGSADQNLILLDGVSLYNSSHLFGFFSTFNSDAVKDVQFYKGSMPAQYGGRLSSMIDVEMDEGSTEKYELQGGVGLIASRLKVSGPIVKNKGSFMLSARRTYVDLFLKASPDSAINGNSIYFYDLNAKASYALTDNNRLTFSGFLGRDVLSIKSSFGTGWSSKTGSLSWAHNFSQKFRSSTSVIYSDYNYDVENFSETHNFQTRSAIGSANIKQEFTLQNQHHTLRFGLDALHQHLTPGKTETNATSSFNPLDLKDRYGLESAVYFSDEWKPVEKLTVNYGLRLTSFIVTGAGLFKTFNSDGSLASEQSYDGNSIIKTYLIPEPRLSLNYELQPKNSFKMGYSRTSQNVHQIASSTSNTPNTLYLLSTNNIKPQLADQFSLGYFRGDVSTAYEFSVESYYRSLYNQIDLRSGSELIYNENLEASLLFGRGRAYGAEFLLRKKTGALTGWIGYTLSKVEERFDEINNGRYFAARQDRTHDLSVVGMYKLSKRVSFSSTFIFSSGNAVTFPSGKYEVGGMNTYYYTERNGYRMPATHRLDVGATFEGKPHERYQSSFTLGIYNVYNRKNPYFITFRDSKINPAQTQAVQTSLFGLVPSITWNFKY